MSAIAFGVCAALMWASSNLCSARAVRTVPQQSVVAWIMFVGLLITAPFAAAGGVPVGLTASRLVGLSVVGVVVVTGLVLVYGAFRIGKVSLVAPLAATEGAVAAVISAVAGESLPLASALLLVAVVVGVALSVLARDAQPVPHGRPLAAAAMATASAGFFGLGLFLTGRLSADLPLAWVLLVPRVVGTVVLFCPLLLSGRLRLSRQALPLVAATGASEVLGYLAFGLGARTSIATTAVLASQVATVTVIGGRVLFEERLGRLQLSGIAILMSAVAGLALRSAM